MGLKKERQILCIVSKSIIQKEYMFTHVHMVCYLKSIMLNHNSKVMADYTYLFINHSAVKLSVSYNIIYCITTVII